jgi:uncharacterized membrane protein YjjP (DUF1212 family)
MTDNGKGWLVVALAFTIGIVICAVTYYYTHYVL